MISPTYSPSCCPPVRVAGTISAVHNLGWPMSDRITVRVDQSLVDAIDKLRVARGTEFHSRQDLLRHILLDWMISHQHLAPAGPEPLLRSVDASSRQ